MLKNGYGKMDWPLSKLFVRLLKLIFTLSLQLFNFILMWKKKVPEPEMTPTQKIRSSIRTLDSASKS